MLFEGIIRLKYGEEIMKLRAIFQLGICFLTATILVGCVTTPSPSSTGVFPTGMDTYTIVVTTNNQNEDIGNLQKIAYQEANDFCESEGKVFQPIATNADPASSGNNWRSSFELRFRALYPDDPDYKGPDWEPMPDVKVDVKGK